MHIYLLRHGIAEDYASSGDAARALTSEGIVQMRLAAHAMQKLGVAIDLLLSSPLVRARQTAEIVGAALDRPVVIEQALAAGMRPQALRPVLARHAAQRVMLVGHEPDLSTAISWMIGGGQVSMKKGALALVELPSDEQFDGVLVWLAAPRLLRAIGESFD